MSSNTLEYRTIVQCNSELVTALKNDLNLLSSELSAASLITGENATALTNQATDVTCRAGQLVGSIKDKIKLDSDNYRSFVRVLKQREDDHKEILKILDEKYAELGESVFASKIGTVMQEIFFLAFMCRKAHQSSVW